MFQGISQRSCAVPENGHKKHPNKRSFLLLALVTTFFFGVFPLKEKYEYQKKQYYVGLITCFEPIISCMARTYVQRFM